MTYKKFGKIRYKLAGIGNKKQTHAERLKLKKYGFKTKVTGTGSKRKLWYK